MESQRRIFLSVRALSTVMSVFTPNRFDRQSNKKMCFVRNHNCWSHRPWFAQVNTLYPLPHSRGKPHQADRCDTQPMEARLATLALPSWPCISMVPVWASPPHPGPSAPSPAGAAGNGWLRHCSTCVAMEGQGWGQEPTSRGKGEEDVAWASAMAAAQLDVQLQPELRAGDPSHEQQPLVCSVPSLQEHRGLSLHWQHLTPNFEALRLHCSRQLGIQSTKCSLFLYENIPAASKRTALHKTKVDPSWEAGQYLIIKTSAEDIISEFFNHSGRHWRKGLQWAPPFLASTFVVHSDFSSPSCKGNTEFCNSFK